MGSLDSYQAIMVIAALGALYAAWVLVPLMPAVLIYWLLPNNQVRLADLSPASRSRRAARLPLT